MMVDIGTNDLILSLDPSSTVVGYCLGDGGERLISAGVLRTPGDPPLLKRTDNAVEDVTGLIREYHPRFVLIEIPTGKVHGRIGKASGLSIYGFAVGRIYQAAVTAAT